MIRNNSVRYYLSSAANNFKKSLLNAEKNVECDIKLILNESKIAELIFQNIKNKNALNGRMMSLLSDKIDELEKYDGVGLLSSLLLLFKKY